MNRISSVIVAVIACLSLRVFAADSAADRRKAEAIVKADNTFGRRYTPSTEKPLRLYDEATETGPPDEVFYWHGSNYVIDLIFAADGSIARLLVFPEALLHTDNWNDVPDSAELSQSEMQWLVASANALQPLGKAEEIVEAPGFCFQSGQNLYCFDTYELASISHYHQVRSGENQKTNERLREVKIVYRQFVNGIVEDARIQGSQRQIKVGGQWYYGEKPKAKLFERARIGTHARLVTLGCTPNVKVCSAVPQQSKPKSAEQ